MQYPLIGRCWTRFATPMVIAMSWLSVSGQVPPRISEDARTIGIKWLLSNCEVGEGSRLRDQLLAFRTELETFFLWALQQGPDEKQLSDLRRASEARYEQRQQTLKTRKLPIKEEDVRTAQSTTREQYIAQETEDFLNRYKSQAVAGLGIVGGTKAKAELQLLSKDEKSPLRTSALEALKNIAARTKKQ